MKLTLALCGLGGGWLCCWCDVRGGWNSIVFHLSVLQGDSDVSFINHDTVELEVFSAFLKVHVQ